MRLFLAVAIGDEVRLAAARHAGALRTRLERTGGLDARWIPEENLHLTLWFLGELDDARASQLRAVLVPGLPAAPFDVHLAGFGAFPPSRAPRVLWMGVRAGADQLRQVHGLLGDRLAPLGFEPERRPYAPHLTLARVREVERGVSALVIARVLADIPADAGISPVAAVTLFRSHLSPKGASYEPLLRVPLVR